VISWLAVAKRVDIIRIWAANATVDYVDACLRAKNLEKMSNEASTPVG